MRPTREQLLAALHKAAALRLVAYRVDASTYEVPSSTVPGQLHTCRHLGPAEVDWSCSCAGGRHPVCLHRATAMFAWKRGVHAKRPVDLPCAACGGIATPGFALCAACAQASNEHWDTQAVSAHLSFTQAI